MSDCVECGQPMLPEGVVKRVGEYDHASGCPKSPFAVPSQGPQVFSLRAPDSGKAAVIMISNNGEPLVELHPTGEVTLHGDPNEAARIFWDSVANMAPPPMLCLQCGKKELDQMAVWLKLGVAESTWLLALATKLKMRSRAQAIRHILRTFARSLGYTDDAPTS